MKVTTISVIGGWQTKLEFPDGSVALVGPACNRVSDTWDWQRANLFDLVSEYVLVNSDGVEIA
jgi:hypothetical protein